MAWSADERREKRTELARSGFRGDYLDTWPPKAHCWGHTPMLNNYGKVVKPAGRFIPDQPGNPDTAIRLSRRGVLPNPPNENCRCKACRERDWNLTVVNSSASDPDERHQLIDVTIEQKEGSQCLACDYVVTTGKNPKAALRAHRMHHHKDELVAVV